MELEVLAVTRVPQLDVGSWLTSHDLERAAAARGDRLQLCHSEGMIPIAHFAAASVHVLLIRIYCDTHRSK